MMFTKRRLDLKFLFMNLFTLLLIFKPLSASLADIELFGVAQNEFENGNIKEALDKYQDITIKGAAVWYNMGVCHHALKNYAYALLSWRRAQKSVPYNLWMLCEKNICSIKNESLDGRLAYIVKLIHANFVKRFGLLFVQLLFLLCWSLLLIIGYRLCVTRKWLILIFISLIFIFSSMLLISDWYYKKNLHAIIIPSQVIIYAGPDITYHPVGQLQGLDEIVVEEQKDTWYKIHCLGSHGWIQKDTCEIV